MKFKGVLIGEASGSVASNTFSHNRGGQYVRQRSVPTNPNTSFQQAIRGFVTLLTSNWGSVLAAAQRAAWDVYAENVLLPDTLGEPRNPGGLGMYVRSNVPRLQAALPRQDDAPTTFNLGEFTNPAFGTLDGSFDTVQLAFTDTDAWANEDDSAMLLYLSRPQNASINYFKGPYRFAGSVLGDAMTPPTSPQSFNAPFPFAPGNRVFGYTRVTRADGRLSGVFRLVGLGS